MINDLNQLYQDQIRDIYSAETQLLEALPKMASAASNDELRKAFTDHLEETREQKSRLEKIASRQGFNLGGETCDAMRGLITEAEKHKGNTVAGPVRDAVLIASANRVEHYEIAAYGVAKTFASELGYDDDAKLLDASIEEEGAADKKLTKIATGGFLRGGINDEAQR